MKPAACFAHPREPSYTSPLPVRNPEENEVCYMIRCLRARDAVLLFCYDQQKNVIFRETTNFGIQEKPDYGHYMDEIGRQHTLSLEGRYIRHHHIVSDNFMKNTLISEPSRVRVACNIGPRSDYESSKDAKGSVETDIVVGSCVFQRGGDLLTALLGAVHHALLRSRASLSNDFHVFTVISNPEKAEAGRMRNEGVVVMRAILEQLHVPPHQVFRIASH